MSAKYQNSMDHIVRLATKRFQTWNDFGFKRGFFNLGITPWPTDRTIPAVFHGLKLFDHLDKSDYQLDAHEISERFEFLDELLTRIYREESRLIETCEVKTRLGFYSSFLGFVLLLAATLASAVYVSEAIACTLFVSTLTIYQLGAWIEGKKAVLAMKEDEKDSPPDSYLPWCTASGH